MEKKGQGINAAVLVAIIAGLIIIYFIFLPASEREDLLENKTDKKTATLEEENILLQEFPGRVDYIKEAEDKTLPNVYLFESTDAKELEKINPFQVRNGVWDEKTKTAEFSIEPDNTANVLLSFKAKKHNGILTIKLNDRIIFENEITSEDVEPVRLRDTYLEEDNALEFSVSSVGWRFWTTNEYSIENAKITGDITDLSRQKSQNVVTLTKSEYQNLEKATLKFIPYCSNIANVGILEVLINNHGIFSTVPVCDDSYSQSVPTGVFNAGENDIVFRTQKGSYSVEQIRLVLESKESKSIKYFFEINETTLEGIDDDEVDLELTIEFAKELDEEEKRAELNINGHFITLDLDGNEFIYTKNIDDWAEEGNNYIEIKPKMVLDIKEIRVELKD